MFGLREISVQLLTGTPWLVALAALALFGLTWLMYRHTNPPLPTYVRVLLGLIRLVAVLALVIALAEPVISYVRDFERQPRVALIVDHSGSMDRVENGRTRRERVDSLMATEAFRSLDRQADVSRYYFGTELETTRESVERDATGLGTALENLSSQELVAPADHWLMLSDGRSNRGSDPVEVIAVAGRRLTAVDMAARDTEFDISIASVEYNPVMFVGQASEFQVRLSWRGAAGKQVQVNIEDGQRVVTQQRLAIDEPDGRADIKLEYRPTEPGQRLLSVKVPELEGETAADNNRRTISVKVLKSRLQVLLVSSHPDYELGFLNRFLQQADRYEVDLRVLGPKAGNLAGSVPDRQTELNRFDLVILHDPSIVLLQSRLSLLRSYLNDRGGAVWLMMGKEFASGDATSIGQQLLPFYPSRPDQIAYFDFHAAPSEDNLFHPAVRLADDRASVRQAWAELPPFAGLIGCDQMSEQGSVLAYAAGAGLTGDRLPALGYRRLGAGKLIAQAATPIWRWAFEPLGYRGEAVNFERFIEGVVSWLTVPDDFDPVRIQPEKEIFTRGEQVRFQGFAFDPGYRPLTNVTGSIRLIHQGTRDTLETDLVDKSEGSFLAEFSQLAPGRYQYEGSLDQDGALLKTVSGEMQVESYSVEEYDQSGNPALLQNLARISGGDYFRYDEFEEMIASLESGPISESVSSEISLRGNYWLLALFILALAAEWLIRKLRHLL